MSGWRSSSCETAEALARLLERRRRARARVTIVDEPRSGYAEDGSIGSKQSAEVTLPRAGARADVVGRVPRAPRPHLLELPDPLLARTSCACSTREDAREVVVFRRPFVLLRFHKPEYHLEPDGGTVTWPIDKGLLVAPAGRGAGYLRLSVSRPTRRTTRRTRSPPRVTSEVVELLSADRGLGLVRHGRPADLQPDPAAHPRDRHARLPALAGATSSSRQSRGGRAQPERR